MRARAEVRLPEGAGLEKLEIYRGETRLATLYQEPFVHRVPLPDDAPTYVRAIGHLTDGATAEDLAWVNAPGFMEEVEVDLVEIYAAVTGADGRPVGGLTAADFTVTENGEPQEIRRLEPVADRPLSVTVLLDTSASMEERLGATRDAAIEFLEAIVTPKDRVSLVTFNDRPHVRTGFTSNVGELSVELAGIKAERGTALFDSVITALYGMNGLSGQRAVLLLTDGKDESSRHPFEDALEYAQVAGVTLYTIGLGLPKTDFEVRRQLSKLAQETGGESFFVGDPAELPAVYERIERELRSRYLLVYQSSHEAADRDFRTVEATVARPGVQVQAMRGYYP